MADFSDRLAHLTEAQRALFNLRREERRARPEPIAIVGMACRFPGAESLDAYWRLLRDGVDAITEVPPARWDVDAFYDPDPQAPGKMNTRWGGFVPGVDLFDPEFFGISPREISQMDPQQRMLLETAWEALEDAGVVPERLAGSPTGVFVGIFMDDYRRLQLADRRRLDGYVGTGSVFCVAANRISYLLDLRGPSMAIDTACSSSLVAVHLACQSLLAGETTLAIAGGVNALLVPEPTIEMTKAGLMSPDGRCKAFDASANGYVRSEGAGMVVLKPLSRALADGDPIYAVLRGSAVNQDGHTNGITSPSRFAQEAVLSAACQRAGVMPSQVQYVEAHGTGTSVGDAIECRALGAFYGKGRPAGQPLTIGSVKTNIGHPETAAGVASLIKVALALRHGEIPASLHLKTPNPNIPFDELRLKVQTRFGPWPRFEGIPVLAGVSSFGFGGTNAHVVLEEAPKPSSGTRPSSPEADRPVHVLALSAQSRQALEELAGRYRQRLETAGEESLADLCFSANTGRSAFAHRLAVVSATPAGMAAQLAAQAGEGPAESPLQAGRRERPRLAFLFTGQGAQFPGMARRLFDTQPSFRRVLLCCQELLAPHLDRPLLSVLFPEPGDEHLLSDTAYTQPALFALEYALAETWKSWGIVPDALLGHSVGEYTAACQVGIFTLEEGLRLIARRARLMADLPREGAMAAIFAGEAEVAEAIAPRAGDISIAAINGPLNTVVSGRRPAVEEVAAAFRERGVKTESLQVSHAFHSPLLEPILDRLEEEACKIRYADPQRLLISNLTGEAFAAGEMNASYWRRHARQPVRFRDSMEALRRAGCEIFVEIGPGTTLLGMGAKAWSGPALWLPSLRKGQDDWEQILATLGTLFTHGVEVDWRGFDGDYTRTRERVPTYPWQRQRYWFDTVPAVEPADRPAVCEQLLGRRIDSPIIQGTLHEATFTPREPAFLSDHQVFGSVVVPGACYAVMALGAAGAPAGWSIDLGDVLFGRALALPAEGSRTVQLAVTDGGSGQHRFAVYSRDPEGDGPWTLHAGGELAVVDGGGEETGELPDEILSRASAEIDGADFYEKMKARDIELGPAFRWIERAWHGEGEALVRFRPARSLEADPLLHPGVLDAAFQSLAAALPEEAAEATFLPLALERLHFRAGIGQPVWCHGRLRPMAGRSGAVFTGDLRLLTATGDLVAEVTGLQLKRAERWALMPQTAEKLAEWVYLADWLPAPLPATETAVPSEEQRGVWLLVVAASGTGTAVARHLESRGERCLEVVVSADNGAGGARLDPEDPKPFLRFLQEELIGKGLRCRGAIHLAGLGARLDPAPERLLEGQKEVCGSALQLVQQVARLGLADWQRLVIVTRGAEVLPSDGVAPPALAQTALWGLGASVAFEHPELHCLLVDLDPQATDEEGASRILSELSARDENRVAWRRGERFVSRMISAPAVLREAGDAGDLVRSDGTYLITGGLGSLGLEVSRWLVGRGARHLVLTGRKPATGDRLEGVEELRRNGAEVAVISADVSLPENAARLLAEIGERLPPLRGIFHAAGVVDDGMLLQQSWSRFATVLAPKALGAWNLHALTRAQPLDLFVLFSSATCRILLPGVGPYAAANAFLDGLARLRRSEGLPALSIDWGPWAAVGMAARAEENAAVRQIREDEGAELISPQEGIALLDRLVGANVPQVMAVPMSWPRLLQRFPDGRERPFLAHELSRRRQSSSPGNVQEEKSGLTELFEVALPEEQRDLVASYLREQVTKILRLPNTQELDPLRPLQAFGLDSLMAIELRNRLRTATGRELPATLLFEQPTLQELGEFIFGLLAGPEAGGERAPWGSVA
jgi:acyl transferase domain-containing protein/aryl carrier-like protein